MPPKGRPAPEPWPPRPSYQHSEGGGPPPPCSARQKLIGVGKQALLPLELVLDVPLLPQEHRLPEGPGLELLGRQSRGQVLRENSEKDDTTQGKKARTWATPGRSSATTDSTVRSDRSASWRNCSKEPQRPPRPHPQGRTEAPPQVIPAPPPDTRVIPPAGSGRTRTRAELPSAGVGTGCSTVLAASASATSFPREVSAEEIV